MWPAVKRAFSQEEFRKYVEALPSSKWRPSMIVWHNTAAPSLAQWIKSADADRANGLVPGITRIGNLESFFKNNNGWSGCPHLFIANDAIWVMNPLTAAGVHSPSWNSISFGIEHIGDFDVETDDSGAGLAVKNNGVFATAVLCEVFGIDPAMRIMLHKQDPKTTHDCPGHNMAIEKTAMISSVLDLMAGGEHNSDDVGAVIGGQAPPPPPQPWLGKTNIGDLNLRRGPGVLNESMGKLPLGLALTVSSEAKNGTTAWLQVTTPAGYTGWVSGAFVERIGI